MAVEIASEPVTVTDKAADECTLALPVQADGFADSSDVGQRLFSIEMTLDPSAPATAGGAFLR